MNSNWKGYMFDVDYKVDRRLQEGNVWLFQGNYKTVDFI